MSFHLLSRWFTLLALVGPGLALAAPSAVVTTPKVRAELIAHAPEGVSPGKPLQLALQIEHQPHWHTYWKNPGDSGLPTTLEFKLPAGFVAGGIEWPTPQRLPIGPLMNYGFEGKLVLPVTVQVPASFNADRLDVKLHAEWLVCKEICIPESGDFALQIPARAATAGHAQAFSAARAAAPQAAAGAQAQAEVKDGAWVLRATGLPAAWQDQALQLFPELGGLLAHSATVQPAWQGATWTISMALDPQRSEAPTVLPVVLKLAGPGGGAGAQPAAIHSVALPVQMAAPWPAMAGTNAGVNAGANVGSSAGAGANTNASSVASATVAAPSAAVGATTGGSAAGLTGAPATGSAVPNAALPSFGTALLFALLGGALLNLMPCVFPVLSLKVLGFAQQGADRRQALGGALAYAAGVVLSFVGLAAVLLALRAGGEQLGWGFQLQSPAFIAALAVLFTLMGLNLAGAFEVGMLVPSAWAGARARHPLVDSFLTGMLAVAIASPCTAPFMGVSLGLALTLPNVQALLIFAVLGLGMALPFAAAAAWPALARALPKPGAWMAHFKSLMAFPMFATVVWLTWVLGQQVGIDGAAALLAVLVAVAFAAWAWAGPALGTTARRGFGAASILVLAAALAWALPTLRPEVAEAAVSAVTSGASGTSATPGTLGTLAGSGATGTVPAGTAGSTNGVSGATAAGTPGAGTAPPAPRWQAWSPERVAQAQAEGRPVFVDFTAAWCVTCQYNKRTTFDKAEVLAAFDNKRVLLLRADWTRRDATIAAELARLQRSGVPVYALYRPGSTAPQLLSELPSVAEVLTAVAALPAV
jgi:thiol:disulfide interchange protein/DsbC/DsbD-like thiol-disulfide interchange protein